MIRLVGGEEKWKDIRDLVFSHLYLVERIWKSGKIENLFV